MRATSRWGLLLLSTILIGCGGTEPSVTEDTLIVPDTALIEETAGPSFSPEVAEALGTDGTFRAGYREVTVTYMPPGFTEERSLVVGIWYPTEDTEGDPVGYLGLLEFEDVFVNASLAPTPDGALYPVHVHSHGHQGFAGGTHYLMRHFATHGWVVVAPNHTGNTLVDNLDPRPPWMYVVRGLDITETLNAMEQLEEEDPLAQKMQLNPVIMSGHSFGGYTTYAVSGASFDPVKVEEVCSAGCDEGIQGLFSGGVKDPRVVAAIPMAAGNRAMFGNAGYGTIDIPLMVMSGDADSSVKNEGQGNEIWKALQDKDAIRVDVSGGCHQLYGLGACHLIDDDEGFRIVKTYALAFARAQLLSDTGLGPILDGSYSVSDKVTFFKP